ncbi:class I SAM-dependent methyltransferase [Ruminiclostridium cellobioparum]|uniref:O-Methyltransferase involved in polyketide biosynthesis n=1 Tax=Ruminiclostridium cellobioparum subsp. termitidis CT1112 TaxID=1195236 RepID=S0FI94_RUMCE|nr:class I SAM-dependent methyltransferase [Ruminiclostridium cellobioparum]EMS69786.1 O-Methyltransferase involved in polyketide biosynthesis [Ruminiclostridium cellobioparum subsp. termitidis CT1112]
MSEAGTELLKTNTVQHTLCIPLWGRMLAAHRYPVLFPDRDAERIIRALGIDFSDKKIYKMEYTWLNTIVRQYDLAWEITHYLKAHPKAAVVELGAGLSTLRRQIGNDTNPWYNMDMAEVITLREAHIPTGEHEKNIVCNLNDYSWFDAIDFKPQEGIVFVAGGLFYYFKKEQVQLLISTMAQRFPGGMIAFDATNAMGLKAVNKEVGMAGSEAKSFFSLENPKRELEAWSAEIVNVEEKDYMRGYLDSTSSFGFMTQLIMRFAAIAHISFIVHAEFAAGKLL